MTKMSEANQDDDAEFTSLFKTDTVFFNVDYDENNDACYDDDDAGDDND